MIAVFVNSILVFSLGFLGSKLKDFLNEDLKDSIMKFLAVAIIVIGIRSALDGDIVVIIISVVLGLIIGDFLKIDQKINKLTTYIEKRFAKESKEGFSEGFLSSSILFCFGAMGIIASIKAGVSGDSSMLMVKGLIDGIVAFFMAQSLGLGVCFSSISLLIFQGALVILSGFFEPLLTKEVIDNISGTGGLTIIVIGLCQLKLLDAKLANILPAIAIPVIYGFVISLF